MTSLIDDVVNAIIKAWDTVDSSGKTTFVEQMTQIISLKDVFNKLNVENPNFTPLLNIANQGGKLLKELVQARRQGGPELQSIAHPDGGVDSDDARSSTPPPIETKPRSGIETALGLLRRIGSPKRVDK